MNAEYRYNNYINKFFWPLLEKFCTFFWRVLSSQGPGCQDSSSSFCPLSSSKNKSKKKSYREHSNIKAWVSVHCLALRLVSECHAKWPRGSKEFQHPAQIEPMSPDSLLLALTTKPWVQINLGKKQYMTCYILQPWTNFLRAGLLFQVQDCSSWL